MAKGDRTTPLALEPCDAEIAALEARTLAAMKPTRPRTAENFVNLMKELSK